MKRAESHCGGVAQGRQCRSVCCYSPDRNLQTIGWIAMTLCSDIHGSKTLNPYDVGDPFTFPLAPTAGGYLWFPVKYLHNYWILHIYLYIYILTEQLARL